MHKRLIFTVTAGRTGTQYLSRLLAGLPGVTVAHEPLPSFQTVLPEARDNPAVALRFLEEKKLPHIASLPGEVYVETSHYACKGFIEPMMQLGVVPDLILLKRQPRQVAASWFLLGADMCDATIRRMREGRGSRRMLTPAEPNFLPLERVEGLNDYQLCYWYALESAARMRHYDALVSGRGGKTFETCMEHLADGRESPRLMAWLGRHIPDTDPGRSNEKSEEKRPERIAQLRLLDLDTLEQEVRDRCLPGSSGVAENFNRFMQECAR
jgi:hypothetical protein